MKFFYLQCEIYFVSASCCDSGKRLWYLVERFLSYVLRCNIHYYYFTLSYRWFAIYIIGRHLWWILCTRIELPLASWESCPARICVHLSLVLHQRWRSMTRIAFHLLEENYLKCSFYGNDQPVVKISVKNTEVICEFTRNHRPVYHDTLCL